jgi:hypothetical protein
MLARTAATVVAVALLFSSTAGAAAADQSGQLGGGPAELAGASPAGLDSLLAGEQLAPGGPAQWYAPFWSPPGDGTNYLALGIRSYGPFYGFGPYPTPQTAAFFGASSTPFGSSFGNNGLNGTTNFSSLMGFGPLATINANGFANVSRLSLASLAQLGVGSFGVPSTFFLGGQGFTTNTGFAAGAPNLAGLLGFPSSFGGFGTTITVGAGP